MMAMIIYRTVIVVYQFSPMIDQMALTIGRMAVCIHPIAATIQFMAIVIRQATALHPFLVMPLSGMTGTAPRAFVIVSCVMIRSIAAAMILVIPVVISAVGMMMHAKVMVAAAITSSVISITSSIPTARTSACNHPKNIEPLLRQLPKVAQKGRAILP